MDDNKRVHRMRAEDQKILDNQLYEYIEKGDIPKIEMLLILGADMNSFNDKGMTAVSSVRDAETLKFLIEKGANIEEVDKRGDSLFYHLIWREKDPKNTLLMQYMIDNKLVDIHQKNDYSDITTFAFFAVHENNLDALKVLIENGVSVNDVNQYGQSMLHKCVEKHLWENRTDMIEYLIGKGADVNIKDNEGDTPLMEAVRVWYKDNLMERLIKHGADVNVVNNEGKNLLWGLLDVNEACLENLNLIFDNGFNDLDSKFEGYSYLLYAITRRERKDIVNFFIDKGCDVNEKNDKEQTPLMLVFDYDKYITSDFDKELIIKIIEKSDDINARDNEGKSVLNYFASSRYKEDLGICVKLFEKGLDIKDEEILSCEDISLYIARETIMKAKNIVQLKKETRKNNEQEKKEARKDNEQEKKEAVKVEEKKKDIGFWANLKKMARL